MPARHVIRTVESVWQGGSGGEDALLESCYRRALGIAFPAVSTGGYGFPAGRAARIAVRAVRGGLAAHDGIKRVAFACFSEERRGAPPSGAGCRVKRRRLPLCRGSAFGDVTAASKIPPLSSSFGGTADRPGGERRKDRSWLNPDIPQSKTAAHEAKRQPLVCWSGCFVEIAARRVRRRACVWLTPATRDQARTKSRRSVRAR